MITFKRTFINNDADSQYKIYRLNDPHLADQALIKLREIDNQSITNTVVYDTTDRGIVLAVRFGLPHIFPQRYGIAWREQLNKKTNTYDAYVFYIGLMP